MYMEGRDILSKHIMNETVVPWSLHLDNVKIYRTGEHVTKIEIMEERNEIILWTLY